MAGPKSQHAAKPLQAMSANEVKVLRARTGLSQAAFARALNISTVLVQAWESGRRVPAGAALRLLTLGLGYPELLFASAEPIESAARVPRMTPATRRGRASTGKPPTSQTDRPRAFDELLLRLANHGVHFIVIGGVAAQLRGATAATDDLDILYDRASDNLTRLATALRGITPTLRGAPGSIPFSADPRTLAHTSFLALDSRLGPLDLRQRVAGVGDYAVARALSDSIEVAGRPIRTLTVAALIASKRATGRSKDRDQIAALEALR